MEFIGAALIVSIAHVANAYLDRRHDLELEVREQGRHADRMAMGITTTGREEPVIPLEHTLSNTD